MVPEGQGVAVAWIESHQGLGRHPKTKQAARALGISRVQLVGHLHYLWWWALDFAEDGNLAGIDPNDIAEEAMWEGDASTFIDALTAAGFLTDDLHINDWDDYTGRLIAQRESNRERQRRFRERRRSENGPENVTDSLPNEGVTVTSPLRNDATVPNPTKPNRTEPVVDGADAPKPKAKRATALPDDFELTDQMRKFASDRDFTEADIDLEFQKFVAYWQGEGRTKKDWPATWRSWILNAVDRRPRRPANVTKFQGSKKQDGGWSPYDIAAYATELERQGQ